MKIKTLTTFDVYNYGASLQAYALQTFLRKQGHEVEIIDYQPEYLTRRYDYKWVNPESFLSHNAVTRTLYRFMKFVQRQTTMRRKRAFDQFHDRYLIRTSKKYFSNRELYLEAPSADVYVVGSDQVWNVFYETGRDDAFFLDFVRSGKKISYAASFSYLDIDNDQLTRIKKLLSSFAAIGVREYQGVEIIERMHLDSAWVLDPVFLLSPDEWKSVALPYQSKDKYILVYDFEGNKEIETFVRNYAKRNNLKIFSINDTYPNFYADKNFNNAGPLEFVSLIQGCSAFVSNSFHGTVFSIIFNKPVFVFNRKKHKVNSRMESLMKLFDLEDRILSNAVYDGKLMSVKFDYSQINRKIEKEKKKSIDFLIQNL